MDKKTIQLILPMAGKGSRFVEGGYLVPKPMLPIGNYPMFLSVLSNVYDERIASITLVKHSLMEFDFDFDSISDALGIPVKILTLNSYTDGAASTVEIALRELNPDLPVVIANSDQYIAGDLTSFYDALISNMYSGVILTMNDTDPKWSYVRVNDSNFVIDVVEKVVVSDLATVGIYGFATGKICWSAISEMKAAGFRVNGEYYLAPAYNYFPPDADPINYINLGPVGDVMFGLGIPEDYESFLLRPECKVAISQARAVFGEL